MTERVVALIDMDCFYCQVETRLNPDLKGLPLAVVQYNEWKGGGIIAVNYEAREKGVTRHMRGSEAKKQCPEIILVKVPTQRDKADLSRYREAGREVATVLCTFSECVERASVDEAYIDLTAAVNKRIAERSPKVFSDYLANTYIVGYTTEGSNNEEERAVGLNSWLSDIYDASFQDTAAQKLAIGAAIVEEMRKAVFEMTGFNCSAGIAHNKILAKLACGLHKPNRQTIVPQASVPSLYKNLPVKKVRSLGGKLGEDLTDRLGINVVADLLKFSESELQKIYDCKMGSWLYNIARGYDYEPVTPRLLSKSIGCCKKFPGRTALISATDIRHWVTKLAEELLERLIEDQNMNKRRAQLLTVSLGLEVNRKDIASSKSVMLQNYNLERIVTTAYSALKKACLEDRETKLWSPPIKYLGLSAGKFISETSNKIMQFFKTVDANEESTKQTVTKELPSIVERAALQDVSNNEMSGKLNFTKNDGEKEPSFFEKMLLQKMPVNEGKLNILPDLNKPPCLSDNESSLDSCTSVNLIQIDNLKVDYPQLDINIKNSDPEMNQISKFNLNSKNNVGKSRNANLTKTKPISSFFSAITVNKKWINPQEIFPDICDIDDDLIGMLPQSFRKKILELRKVSEKSAEAGDCGINNINACSVVLREEISSSSRGNTGNKIEDFINSSNGDNASDDDIFENESTSPPKYIECRECGEHVAFVDQEIHSDLHLAMKLDKELNSETSFPPIINKLKLQPPKKRKTKSSETNCKVTKKTKGIKDFFKN